MEDDQHGAERAGKSQPRVWPASARAETSRSMAEDDDHFRQEADEEGRYWMDARTVGICQREIVVCRQKPIRAGRSEKSSRRAMFAGEWLRHVASGSGRQ